VNHNIPRKLTICFILAKVPSFICVLFIIAVQRFWILLGHIVIDIKSEIVLTMVTKVDIFSLDIR
jgi:hypothetical protein